MSIASQTAAYLKILFHRFCFNCFYCIIFPLFRGIFWVEIIGFLNHTSPSRSEVCQYYVCVNASSSMISRNRNGDHLHLRSDTYNNIIVAIHPLPSERLSKQRGNLLSALRNIPLLPYVQTARIFMSACEREIIPLL